LALQAGLTDERALNFWKPDPYLDFACRVQGIRSQVREFVLKEERPYVLGASTKANFMFEWFGLDRTVFLGASDRDPRKLGREMVGTRIPIVSEEEARRKASAFVVGPFFFRGEMLKREEDFLQRGGKICFPMPRFEVVTGA
jgi:NDP-4-keto-2,6-dideoxyhexose 3-C-methyltransferase